MIYYYVLLSNILDVQQTDHLDELISLIFKGDIALLSDTQIADLDLSADYNDRLKKKISAYTEEVPLYDIASNYIYPIHKQNVYPRVLHYTYRFVDEHFYQDLLAITNPSTADKYNTYVLSFYDINVLSATYYKIFYDSFVINSYITNCRRPSFASGMLHIQPYYSINELYYLAYDWNLAPRGKLNEQEIRSLCKQISHFDISSKTLLDHQMYIYDSKAIGLVKHYSLFGSYYMNVYLRKYACCLTTHAADPDAIVNKYLQNQIEIMIKLIVHAPVFSKSHTVYRFVETDDYLQHLAVGDTYKDPSFMSCTRNPFYYKENYNFGYILIKIKLPKDKTGIGLCIESYSNFPSEEEIVLPPTTTLRLDRVVSGAELEHAVELRATKKYEFTLVSNDYIAPIKNPIRIYIKNAYVPEERKVDLISMLTDTNISSKIITDRLFYFRTTYVNMNNQFVSSVAGTDYVFSFEAYDSKTVYKKFFYYEVSDGIMITSANATYGNINLLLELGPDIHVNYYFKYSVMDTELLIDLDQEEWIEFLSIVAYVVGSRYVVIHPNYILDHDETTDLELIQMKTRYAFAQNLYMYMKYGRKMFSQFDAVTAVFDYVQIDWLRGVKVDAIVSPADADELYRVAELSGTDNVFDFYLYIMEVNPRLLDVLNEKLDRVYEPDDNPFIRLNYQLDPWSYLKERELIQYLPSEKEFTKGSFKKLVGNRKIPKFKNRLRAYLAKISKT